MKPRDEIAKMEFDIAGQSKRMALTFYKPILEENGRTWGCEFEFDAPFEVTRTIFGETSLQALVLALKVASGDLYGSALYREGKVGVFGEYGGNLLIPATQLNLDIAPFPF
jgi:hypothetical protein